MRVLIFDPQGRAAQHDAYPWEPGEQVLFMGEIENMPGHGVFHTTKAGLKWGYHIDNFREPTDDEL